MADRSVRVVLDASVSGFVGGMAAATQSALGFAKTSLTVFADNQARMNQLAGTAFKVGAGLTALAGFAVKAAMDWESAWAGVTKTVSGTPAQLAAIEDGLRGLATSMPESHQEIAAVAEAAGQLGIARENIVGFTRVMVMLGDSTNLSSQEAATSIAQLMNIMGTAPQSVGRLGAALVQLGNNGASTEKQIIDMAQRIAGAGRIVGLSEQNVLGLASAVASTGIEVEAGGTAISQALISATTAVATNSAQLQVWADTAGMSAKQFAHAWETDPAAAFLAFEQGLDKQGKKAFVTLNKLGLDGQRVGRVLVNLAGANKLLGASFADADQAWKQNTALINEAEKRYDTVAAKAKIAWNQIKDSAIDAGTGLLPVVAAMAGGVGNVTDAFKTLPGPVKGGLTAMAALTGVSLLALAGFIKLAQGVRNLSVAMGFMSVGQAGKVGATLGTMGRYAGVAVLPVIALSAAVNAFSKTDPATVKQWTAAFLDLGKGGKAAVATLEDLVNVRFEKDTFGNLFQDLNAGGLEQGLAKLEGLVGLDPFKSSRESIAAMDAALSNMVDSGNLDGAALGFDRLSIEAAKQGVSIDDLRHMLPGYTAALKAAGVGAHGTADAFKVAAGGSDMLGRRLSELGTDPDKAIAALHKLQDEARGSARDFAGFSKGLEDMGGSLDSWKKKLEDNLTAQRDFNKNIITLGLRGVPDQWLGDLMKKGPKEVGDLVAALSKTSDKELAHFVDLWQNAGTEIADVWQALPTDVKLAISTVGGPKSQAQLAELLVTTTDLSDTDIKMLLSANTDLAKGDIKRIMKLIDDYRKSHPTAVIDADTGPAEAQVLALQEFIARTAGQMPIDGDPKPGEAKANSLGEYIQNQQPNMPIDGDNKPGKKKSKDLEQYVKGRHPFMPINVNTSAARRAISAFFNAWNGKVIHLLPFVGKGGGAMGLRLPQGFASGGQVPGSPPNNPHEDNVPAVGMNSGRMFAVRSGEWIVNGPQSQKNDNWLRAINGGLDLNAAFGSPAQWGFARGGRVPTTTATMAGRSAAGARMEVSSSLEGVEIAWDGSGVARIVRGEVHTVLQAAGRESSQRFQSTIRRA